MAAKLQSTLCFRNLIQSLKKSSSISRVGAYHNFTSHSQVASSLQEPSTYGDTDDEYADLDWNNLGFDLTPTDYMYIMKCTKGDTYKQGKINRYGNIELSPSSAVLNYGQGIFEGLKAFRKEDGRVLLFRPDQNAIRMNIGAERMCMQSPSIPQFIEAVKQTAFVNKRWVPPPGKGCLYIRPLLVGSGAVLGVGPSPEYTFLVYASPVGNYFKTSGPLNLYVEDEIPRASNGGTGNVKTIVNYSPVMKSMTKAKSEGFTDVLYLDSASKKNVEELSASNIFIVKDNVVSTPITTGTILEGVTRKSIIEIARNHGYQVEERTIPLTEVMEADEVFCTGTAISVASVGSITYKNQRFEYKTSDGSVGRELYLTLIGIQTGLIEDKMGWTVEID